MSGVVMNERITVFDSLFSVMKRSCEFWLDENMGEKIINLF